MLVSEALLGASRWCSLHRLRLHANRQRGCQTIGSRKSLGRCGKWPSRQAEEGLDDLRDEILPWWEQHHSRHRQCAPGNAFAVRWIRCCSRASTAGGLRLAKPSGGGRWLTGPGWLRRAYLAWRRGYECAGDLQCPARVGAESCASRWIALSPWPGCTAARCRRRSWPRAGWPEPTIYHPDAQQEADTRRGRIRATGGPRRWSSSGCRRSGGHGNGQCTADPRRCWPWWLSALIFTCGDDIPAVAWDTDGGAGGRHLLDVQKVPLAGMPVKCSELLEARARGSGLKREIAALDAIAKGRRERT